MKPICNFFLRVEGFDLRLSGPEDYYCGALWRIVARCGALWRTVAHCGALWRTVAHCGALWRIGAHWGA